MWVFFTAVTASGILAPLFINCPCSTLHGDVLLLWSDFSAVNRFSICVGIHPIICLGHLLSPSSVYISPLHTLVSHIDSFCTPYSVVSQLTVPMPAVHFYDCILDASILGPTHNSAPLVILSTLVLQIEGYCYSKVSHFIDISNIPLIDCNNNFLCAKPIIFIFIPRYL